MRATAPGGTVRKLLLTSLVLGVIGAVAGIGTWSAFSGTTSNDANSFASGTVAIGDDDANGAIFSLSAMKPGDTDFGCLIVTYTGTLPANVHLYGTTTGTGLDAWLDVKVTRGAKTTGAFDSCTTFTPDATNYIGAGAGVVYSNTLTAYPDTTYAAGLLDPPPIGTLESWTTGESHAYRIDVTLSASAPVGAQGKTATQQFTWEAQNS
jgi:hypothetical protein